MPQASLLSVDTRGLIVVKPTESLTDAVAAECSREIRDMVEFQSGMPLLIDLTQTTSFQITTDQVVELAKSAQKDANRIAIVASDATAYGMARMYEMIADLTEGRVAVFRDEDSAFSWLDL